VREAGVITGVSVSQSTAEVGEVEAATRGDERAFLRDLLAAEGVEEAFVLQTCNRVEAYVVTDDAAVGRAKLADVAPDVRSGAVTELDHEGSLRHLMCVAAGLESLVLGEDQILGQVRDAVEDAEAVGALGPLLSEALTKALHVGERARTETAVNEGVVSLGSAAVELAERRTDGTLADATALVVGAGEFGALTARALAAAGVAEVVVANRTLARAERVADDVDAPARAVPLDAVADAVAAADLVVTATGSDGHVVDRGTFDGAGETTVVDLAQPRDVDPAAAEVTGVDLADMDDVESVTDATRERRAEAAAAVESMVEEELDNLLSAFKRNRADDAIAAMYEGADAVKRRELDRAVSKLEAQGGLTDDQRETVESMADALVGQLLAAPTRSLRDAAEEDDWTTIQTAMRLFDPEFPDRDDDETASAVAEGVESD
jgi:glutamyl-tRNA reductase